jgi:hypothetical protein
LVYIQGNVSYGVLEEESGKRDEEVFLSGGEVGGDSDDGDGWVQGDVPDNVVPYSLEFRLSCHLQDEA